MKCKNIALWNSLSEYILWDFHTFFNSIPGLWFIYLLIFGCAGSSLRCMASSSLVYAALSLCQGGAPPWLQGTGFLLRWLLLFWCTSSRHAWSVTGEWAQLTRGMWDLSSQMRDWTHVSWIGRQTLNCWVTREVPPYNFLN